MKKFNVTGTCVPEKHYMVDISDKLSQIFAMIEDEQYFTINRARQYGKTTTLSQIDRKLQGKYTVIRMSFEGAGENAFKNDEGFMRFFVKKVARELSFLNKPEELIQEWSGLADYTGEEYDDAFDYLGEKITRLCMKDEQDVILLIDEVDKSSDNQIFLNFLGMLRNKYLFRQEGRDTTFKSVVLAGVYDIKNLKLKLRPEDERKYNSPWNIASDFNVDMSFSPDEISSMLKEYEQDWHTGMDTGRISRDIYFYTNGYPFLVSRLCKWIDEEGGRIWSADNVMNAVNAILQMNSTLFDDMIKNVENHSELQEMLRAILLEGRQFAFVSADAAIELGSIFGIFVRKDNFVAISNVIFETYLYNYMMSKKHREDARLSVEGNQFVQDGKLDMPRVLLKFQEIMKAEYREKDERFTEKQGRLLFLCFIKPIINGTGHYYVEPETRNNTRMDIVISYGGEEHIIELKLWHGEKYRADGIKQLESYLDCRNASRGYLVSFSFLQEKSYHSGWLPQLESEKKIFEIQV